MPDAAREEFLFFQPSEPLTKAIAEQNQRLVAESLQRVSPAEELREEAGEGDEPEVESIRASYPERVSRRGSEEQQTRRLQMLMGERLYHFLATLAESPYAQEGGRFIIGEYIPQGMANMLGLAAAFASHEPESEQALYARHLLERFTAEFRDWLVGEHHRSYACAWGEIYLDEEERLMLQTYAFDDSQSEQMQEAAV